ncbi:hypothetical protein F4604DRAFT_1868693, partial [Suillus subluteus]
MEEASPPDPNINMASATNCCCRRVLYNQPDFVAVESNLERICKARGFSVLFLPKFHC